MMFNKVLMANSDGDEVIAGQDQQADMEKKSRKHESEGKSSSQGGLHYWRNRRIETILTQMIFLPSTELKKIFHFLFLIEDYNPLEMNQNMSRLIKCFLTLFIHRMTLSKLE